MKKILLIILIFLTLFFTACKRKGKEELTLYSLDNNAILNNVISSFEYKYNCKIKLIVGKNNENNSYKDAIDKLNLLLLSKNCPDIVMLDGLNYKNYMDKGIFAKLTDVDVNHTFENISKIYNNKGDNQFYGIASRFSLITLQTEKNNSDILSSLQEDNLKITQDNKCSAKNILLSWFYKTQEHLNNEDTIKKYFQAVKYIDNIEDDSGYSVIKQNYKTTEEDIVNIYDKSLIYNYCELTNYSLSYVNGIEDFQLCRNNKKLHSIFLNNKGIYFYLPRYIFSIPSRTNNVEYSKKFIKYVISTEGQNLFNNDGLSIDKTQLRYDLNHTEKYDYYIQMKDGFKSISINPLKKCDEQYLYDIIYNCGIDSSIEYLDLIEYYKIGELSRENSNSKQVIKKYLNYYNMKKIE